ncbi:MAG: translation initiation factor IF-2 [bacterium]
MTNKKQLDKKSPQTRPPIVTLMGHVDHGKTSILDYIRKSKVQAGEIGGITQHTSTYQVPANGKLITFVDTPGHEAFTAMRLRGGQVADIVILVVAANDGVKPQTKESISHIKLAKVPYLVAFNKVDLAEANVEKCRQELAQEEVLTEKFGGDVVEVEVSAKTGKGIDNLLEMILLLSEMQELESKPQAELSAVVLEGHLDTGRGPAATVIVKEGTLCVGQEITTPSAKGKIKALFDFSSKPIKKAGPGTPCEIMGFNTVPLAGELVTTAASGADAKPADSPAGGLGIGGAKAGKGGKDIRLLNLILKADTQGTLEALRTSLTKLEDDKHQINFIHLGVGEISESDLLLAVAGGGAIFGFEVRLTNKVRAFAQDNRLFVKTYQIIYELLDDAKKALEGVLSKEERLIRGRAEVLKIFKLPESGNIILGCKVTLGKLAENAHIQVWREGNPEPLYEGRIKHIQHLKNQVKVAPTGMECGLFLKPQFLEPKKGDRVEVV